MGHLKPRRNTPIVLLSKNDLVGVALDVHGEEKSVFFEDLSGQILQDDELARLLTFLKGAHHCAPGISHARGSGRNRTRDSDACLRLRQRPTLLPPETGLT